MAEIKIELEGVKEFQEKLNKLSAAAKSAIAKDAVDEGGDVIQFQASLNTTKVFSKKQRGQLRNSIRVESKKTNTGAEALIGPHVIYDRIQELGGEIYPNPKGKGYLKFQVDGQWRTIKPGGHPDHVHIPARPYLRPAVTENIDKITQVLKDTISDGIRNAV